MPEDAELLLHAAVVWPHHWLFVCASHAEAVRNARLCLRLSTRTPGMTHQTFRRQWLSHIPALYHPANQHPGDLSLRQQTAHP
jgi:hypothetical protein